MNIDLIQNYIKNISVSDIKKFALKQNIFLSDEEAVNIYNYIRNNYEKLFKDNIVIDRIIDIVLRDIKDILGIDNYNKVYDIYLKYKDKL